VAAAAVGAGCGAGAAGDGAGLVAGAGAGADGAAGAGAAGEGAVGFAGEGAGAAQLMIVSAHNTIATMVMSNLFILQILLIYYLVKVNEIIPQCGTIVYVLGLIIITHQVKVC
jgi:hypothetical protein